MKEENIIEPNYLLPLPPIIPINTGNYQQEYLYGKSDERLKQIQIQDASTLVSWFFCWSATRTTGAWTWNQIVTWVGFKPKYIQIEAILTSWAWANVFSEWRSDWIQTNLTWFNWIGWRFQANWLIASNPIISIYNTGSTAATLVSFNADWFTINWWIIWDWITFNYECFA